MPDRRAIFGRLAGRDAAPASIPEPEGARLSFADSAAAFAENLEAAGGQSRAVRAGELDAALDALRSELGATRVFSSDAPVEADPHALEDLDLAVLRGGPAVAESGAVWWAPASVVERVAGFLALHVVLVVSRGSLVDHLHAAYDAIDPAGASFGCFVAGPSKTADIEQALVIGAHGPLSLTVLLVE